MKRERLGSKGSEGRRVELSWLMWSSGKVTLLRSLRESCREIAMEGRMVD
jgi:hypothetical protein